MNQRSLLAAFLFAALAWATPAQARLGEKRSVVEARFGEPVRKVPFQLGKETVDRRAYHEMGWIIVVTFWEGRSVHEQYFRISDGYRRDWVKEWFSKDDSFYEKGRTIVFMKQVGRHSEGLTKLQLQRILQANAAGQAWWQYKSGVKTFQRSDRAAYAKHLKRGDDGESFLVVTTDFERRLRQNLGDGFEMESNADSGRILSF